ncbi:hypothetical protein DICA4_E29514 [Diutina catenulata]
MYHMLGLLVVFAGSVVAQLLNTGGDVMCTVVSKKDHPTAIEVAGGGPQRVPLLIFRESQYSKFKGNEDLGALVSEKLMGKQTDQLFAFLEDEPLYFLVPKPDTWCVMVGPSDEPVEVHVNDKESRGTWSLPSTGSLMNSWQELDRHISRLIVLSILWVLFAFRLKSGGTISVICRSAVPWVILPGLVSAVVGVADVLFLKRMGYTVSPTVYDLATLPATTWQCLVAQGYGTVRRDLPPSQWRKIKLFVGLKFLLDLYVAVSPSFGVVPLEMLEEFLSNIMTSFGSTIFNNGERAVWWYSMWQGFSKTLNEINDPAVSQQFLAMLVTLVVFPSLAPTVRKALLFMYSYVPWWNFGIKAWGLVLPQLVSVIMEYIPLVVVYIVWASPLQRVRMPSGKKQM